MFAPIRTQRAATLTSLRPWLERARGNTAFHTIDSMNMIKKNLLLLSMSFMVAASAAAANTGTVTFQGNPVAIAGKLPQIGATAPPFLLANDELKDVAISHFGKKRKVLNIFVSIDTPVCDSSVRKFNEMVASLPNTEMIGISNDLPFAQKRFCGAANISNVTMLSTFRSPKFAQDYGVAIPEGALKGLTTRAVVVLDENNKVIYSQRFKEIAEAPDYQKVLEVLKAPKKT